MIEGSLVVLKWQEYNIQYYYSTKTPESQNIVDKYHKIKAVMGKYTFQTLDFAPSEIKGKDSVFGLDFRDVRGSRHKAGDGSSVSQKVS